jgi:hypothetical protein
MKAAKWAVAVTAASATVLSVLLTRRASAAEQPACALLTQAQVTEALGTSVDSGSPVAKPTACQWTGKSKFATLTITEPRAGRSPVDQFEAGKKTTPGITKEAVTGVGDDAYYIYFAKTDRTGLGIVVKKGASVFEVRVYGFTVAQAKTVGKGLARKAAGKI